MNELDPNSFSNTTDCYTTHLDLNLEVDFKRKVLHGYVDVSVERKSNKVDLILDTKDLTILNVRNKNTLKKMNYILGEPNEKFGSRLEVKLPRTVAKKFVIRIDYESSPKASAIQWLEPNQTSGKNHPYMFSISQSIHARTMFPCQDTPSIKAPYSAKITVPYELRAVMSALPDGEEMDEDPLMKNFKFIQKIPVPSYLIALVVGALECKKIGPRSHVWCEKEHLEMAATEFADTERMICIAEELLGPYDWEVCDLLVLPPSFAFGGMENPCLIFVTPTIIVGDKSLVDVVIHEICHSWTGNLVTNQNFEHFWLNEGFTIFVERKIIGRIHGKAHRHFAALEGWKDLEYTIEIMGKNHPLTKLVPDLKSNHPDDSCTSVPYEKGHTLLYYLEQLLGGEEVFEKFLKAYITEFRLKSIDTDTWKSYLYKYFPDKEDILNNVNWDAWLYTPGMPPVKPEYDYSLEEKCIELCNSWVDALDSDLDRFTVKDIENMSSGQVQELLALLLQREPLSIKKIVKLNEEYKLGDVKNFEIRFRWIRLCLKSHWKEIIPEALKFVTEQGRMKFIRPVYRDLYEWQETRDVAISNYKEHVTEMMFVNALAVAKDLHVNPK